VSALGSAHHLASVLSHPATVVSQTGDEGDRKYHFFIYAANAQNHPTHKYLSLFSIDLDRPCDAAADGRLHHVVGRVTSS
jgi:hypothetical protein